jgi:hypothetical protein
MNTPEAFADSVVLTIKTALAPILERMAVADAKAAILPALQEALTEIRERVLLLETKAATPSPVPPPLDIAVLLAPVLDRLNATISPVLERMAAAETRLDTLADVPDRLVRIETTAAAPPAPAPDAALLVGERVHASVGPILERLAATDARLATIGDVRDKVVALETRAAATALPPVEPVDLTPLLERLTALETRVAPLEPVRDRLAALETRSVVTPDTLIDVRERITCLESVAPPPPPVDLGPVLERVAGLEATVAPFDGLRDRVVAVETRMAVPNTALEDVRTRLEALDRAPVDLGPLAAQVAALETRTAGVEDLRQKVAALETKDTRDGEAHQRLTAVQERQARLEAVLERPDPHAEALAKAARTIETLTSDLATVRERLASVEGKPGIPGPPGQDGRDGKDGQDGRDALDIEDFSTGFDQATRELHLRLMRGDRVKQATVVLEGYQRWRGIYQAGETYLMGDTVTHAGSMWHCNERTADKPGEGSKAWQLVVKRGRDGRDWREGNPALPVVTVGRKS